MNNKSFVSYENVYIDKDGTRWFYSFDINTLYKMSTDGKIEYVATIGEYDFLDKGLFFAVGEYSDSIVLIPRAASHIALVNKYNGEYELISLPVKWESNFKFFASFFWKNQLYMFGHMLPIILKIDMESKKIKCIDLSSDIYINGENEPFCRNQTYNLGSKLYIPCMCLNQIMEFDLENDTYEFIKVGSSNLKLSGISGVGDEVWISCLNEKKMFYVNLTTKKIESIDIPPNWVYDKRLIYLMSLYNRGKVILVPAYGNPFVVYDVNTKTISRIDNIPDVCTAIAIRCGYIFQDKFFFVYEHEGKHVIIDSDKRYESCSIKIEENDIHYKCKKINTDFSGRMLEEKVYFSLSDFLSNL